MASLRSLAVDMHLPRPVMAKLLTFSAFACWFADGSSPPVKVDSGFVGSGMDSLMRRCIVLAHHQSLVKVAVVLWASSIQQTRLPCS